MIGDQLQGWTDLAGVAHRHQHDLVDPRGVVQLIQMLGDLFAGAVDEAPEVHVQDLLPCTVGEYAMDSSG